MQLESISSLEKAIAEAKKQCDEATAGDCAAAWDTVEELSAAIAHKKAAVRDQNRLLLHRFSDNPCKLHSWATAGKGNMANAASLLGHGAAVLRVGSFCQV